jgi:hypothetical protein
MNPEQQFDPEQQENDQWRGHDADPIPLFSQQQIRIRDLCAAQINPEPNAPEGFEAILEAYSREPERWDGLE